MFSSSCSKTIAGTLLRVVFGLSLFLVGIAHLLQFSAFKLMVTDGLGALAILGSLWAYVLPVLFIVGGGLFVSGRFTHIATWLVGIGLGSIPVGMLLKPALSPVGLEDVMPVATTTLIWIIVYMFVAKQCGNCCDNDMKGMKK